MALKHGGGSKVVRDDVADSHVERGVSWIAGPPVEGYRHLAGRPYDAGHTPRVTLRAWRLPKSSSRTTPIFSRLSPDDRRKIAEVANRPPVRERGDLIFEQESPSDALYAIASGRVKISR